MNWRALAALPALGTLGAIGWFALWTWPQGRVTPGFDTLLLVFCAGLALPYLLALGWLARQDGREGLRLAVGTATVNALWSAPLAVVLSLFGGFTMGNRDQEQTLLAIVSGALLQPVLLAAAVAGLARARRAETATAPRARPRFARWTLAFVLPALASGASLLAMALTIEGFKARTARAASNTRAAQQTVGVAQACLAGFRELGYPATLDGCAEVQARLHDSGYRLTYLPALPGEDGRRSAYLLCAQPLAFRASGFDTVVASSADGVAAGVVAAATPAHPPTCASVVGTERALAWCAFEFAASRPDAGYPRRLADMATCVSQRSDIAQLGADRITDTDGRVHAYVAGAPDARGRVTRLRIYRLGRADGQPLWLDENLKPAQHKAPKAGPIVEGLPAQAVPEQFMPGCEQGKGEDCYVAGLEWERRLHQRGQGREDEQATALLQAARAAFERGCALANARACASLASALEMGDRIERDVVRAAELYRRACSLGDALGCRRAGEMYESGRRGHVPTLQAPSPPDPAPPDLAGDARLAVDLHARACELGDLEACFIAGRMLADGDGLAADPPRALTLFERACEDALALACERAATLAPERQAEFRQRACALDLNAACEPPRTPPAR